MQAGLGRHRLGGQVDQLRSGQGAEVGQVGHDPQDALRVRRPRAAEPGPPPASAAGRPVNPLAASAPRRTARRPAAVSAATRSSDCFCSAASLSRGFSARCSITRAVAIPAPTNTTATTPASTSCTRRRFRCSSALARSASARASASRRVFRSSVARGYGSGPLAFGLHPVQFRLPRPLVGRRPQLRYRLGHLTRIRRAIPRLLAQAPLAQRHQLRLRPAGVQTREALLHVPLRRLQPRRLHRIRRERRLPG